MSIKAEFVPIVNGKLTQVGAAFRTSKGSVRSAVFRCECGKRIVTMTRLVRIGTTKTCGQCNPRLGKDDLRNNRRTRSYIAWMNMRQRCLNPNSKDYVNYGGRGITICDRWSEFKNFKEDMGEPPTGFSIDRVDNSAGYSKDNCRWATSVEQNLNKRKPVTKQRPTPGREIKPRVPAKPVGRTLTFRGRTLTISEWAKETGVYIKTLQYRLKIGYPVEECLSKTDNRRRPRK